MVSFDVLYPKAIHMRDWKYPLSNVSACGGRGHVSRVTTGVFDAGGNKLMVFLGEPHRSNAEAIAMATEFCEIMNQTFGKETEMEGCNTVANGTVTDILADFRKYVANTNMPPEVHETIVSYIGRIENAVRRDSAINE